MNILKKIICGILTATVGLASFSFNTVDGDALFVPENFKTSGDYDYVILEDDTICLVDYHGSEPNLVLPAQIDGKLVTTCAIKFIDLDYLKSINFPDSITKLNTTINNEYYSTGFLRCPNMQYMYLNNVKEIREDLDGAKTIYMPSSIEYIDYDDNVNRPIYIATIIVEPGSYMEQWAINKQYRYYRLDNRKWVEDSTGIWYLMSDDQMMYGWHRMNDKMYYLDPNQRGMLLTGWQYLGNAWYYLDPLNGGAVASGWLQPDKSTSTWYYCDSYGIMKTGWIFNGNTWYYLDPLAGGAMASGWLQPDKSTGTWYYCDPSGAMRTGWIHLDSGWYYLNSSGEMLADTTTPDGYYVDSNGVWIS